MREVVFAEGAPAPIGPYSQAIRTGGLIFTSGQIPIDPASGELVAGDVKNQTRHVLSHLEAILKEGGSSLEQVVKVSVFLTRLDDFACVNEVFEEYFGEEPPARETVEVSRLPKGATLEISAVARVGL